MARYVNGRTAQVVDVALDANEDGLFFGASLVGWDDMARADDGGGCVILKRAPDTGERLTLDAEEAGRIRVLCPRLVSNKALPRDRIALVAGLMAAAAAISAVFLFIVPMTAGPLAALMPPRYRDRLADIAWAQIDAISYRCEADAGWRALDGLFAALRAQTAAKHARLEVVAAGFPNAFALPDDTVVLTTEMIALAENPDEIAGVIAHELGHIEAGHVLASLVRQMGTGMFIDIVFGGSGAAQTAAVVNVLALRFSREDEEEADAAGLRIVSAANFDPRAIGPLLQRLEKDNAEAGFGIPGLLASHPDTGVRARRAAEYAARPGRRPALSPEDWQAVRAMCQ